VVAVATDVLIEPVVATDVACGDAWVLALVGVVVEAGSIRP